MSRITSVRIAIEIEASVHVAEEKKPYLLVELNFFENYP